MQFAWDQHILSDPIIIIDTSEADNLPTGRCNGANWDIFVEKNYPAVDDSFRPIGASTYRDPDSNDFSKPSALAYAFKDQQVEALDKFLLEASSNAVKTGDSGLIPECARFDASMGWQTCSAMREVTPLANGVRVCSWTWAMTQCDGLPGASSRMYTEADCWEDADDENKTISSIDSCYHWDRGGTTHPKDTMRCCEESAECGAPALEQDVDGDDDDSGRRLSATKDVNARFGAAFGADEPERSSSSGVTTSSEETGEVAVLRSELAALREEVSQLRSLLAEVLPKATP